MLGVRYPTPFQPCSLFLSLYHHIDKPYRITSSLPPYSNMLVVLTYLKSTHEVLLAILHESLRSVHVDVLL